VTVFSLTRFLTPFNDYVSWNAGRHLSQFAISS